MDPIKVLPFIFKLAKSLYDIIEQVKVNRNQCQSLSKRVECIVAALKVRSADEFKGTAMEKALRNLIETLHESVNFVKTFTDASTVSRFLNNSTHQKTFETLNMQLLHNANDLSLVLNMTSVFDQQQDIADRQADLAEISSKLDDIALSMVKQQQELLNESKDMKDEFKRRFNSFKFHLEQDVLKAQNPVEAKNRDEEEKLFLHIPGHDLTSEELIGEGGFADVYRGTWLSQRHRVAIKKTRITYLTSNVRQDFLDEITAMYKIRYDHVLSIFGACIEPNYYALVVEYMSLGSLFNVLKKKEHSLSWIDRCSIALQMTKAVNYLHMMSILHRDIKSLNFLMDHAVNGYIVKISDFGLAKTRQETSRQTAEDNRQRGVGATLLWKAPELLKLGKASKASDIYSLGVVFWELATGCVPYEDMDEAIIIQGVKAGERLIIPNDVPPTFASLISNAWSQEPSDRVTSQQLIQQIMTISPAITATAVISKLSPTTSQPSDSNSITSANCSTVPAAIPVTAIPVTATSSKELHTYQNPRLETLIAQCQPRSTVDLKKQQLTDSDIEIVVQQAIVTKQCTNLWLQYNQITSKGSSTLGDALYTNITLNELWLYSNHVSDAGAHYLAQALSINKTLKKLGLASNDITDTGVVYLVKMLKINSTLTMLGLAMNQISDQGVQMLANALARHNTSLEELTLDKNKSVGDASVDSLVTMIKHNLSMKELWVNDCNLSETGKKKLQKAIEQKKNFKLVTMYETSS